MNKDKLEVIKVVSLAIIAISTAVISWRMGEVISYLSDLVQLTAGS